jgi:two-component system, cell cycle response regulator DivK
MYTILSVEDNMMNKNLLRRYLKHTDVELLEAETGKRGLEIAKTATPDVILLDYHLPDMNGREIARELRKMNHLQDVPIIAITADDAGLLRKQMLSEGFDEVLYKPVSTNSLVHSIEALLKSSIREIA